MCFVKKITSLETYSVRHQVLRKGKPIETCAFIGDDEATTTHFGLFEDGKLIGVVSVFKTKIELFDAENQFQIRGMAVLDEFQNKSFGATLLNAAEKFCIEENANLIWFNAREKAVSFYKKNRFEIIGKAFEISTIGTHFVMFKRLKK